MWNMAVYKLGVLDVLISLSEYALSGDMCVPEISDDTDKEIFIDIREGRHPCIVSDTLHTKRYFIRNGRSLLYL